LQKKEQCPFLLLSVSTERKPAQGYTLFHPHAVSREDELRLQKAALPSRRLYEKAQKLVRSGLEFFRHTYIQWTDSCDTWFIRAWL